MNFKNLLVTGGSGRLGRYVVREFAPRTALTVLDRAPCPEAVPSIEADVLDLDAVRKAMAGRDAVCHLAAIDIGRPAEPEQYFGVNVMGTWNVLQAAHEAGVANVVLASSISATGLDEFRPEFPPEYLPVDEAHPMKPMRAYSVSKLVIEEAARSFARRGGMRIMCLRPMWVAFPSSMAELVRRADDPAFRWLFYYVTPEDTARAFRLALERAGGPAFDAAIVTAGDTCATGPVLEAMARVFGALPPVRDPARYAADPRAALFDGTHAREAIGFEPSSDWRALRRAFEADPRPD